jgi:low temperature requirement protein LtrA
MDLLRRTFRSWWQVPRRYGERPESRQISFLELFYDLVYVVLVAELAHALSTHVDPSGLAVYVFLFSLLWWAWINGALYHDSHGNNDIRTRVATFAQMFSVAGMAVFAHDALGSGARGFALSYAAYLLILAALWWRTGVHDPEHRPLSQPYSLTMLITALLFAASAFLPVAWSVPIWSLATLLSFGLMLYSISTLGRLDPAQDGAVDFVSESMVERFGLFTIIVLGEVIVATVQGLAGQHGPSWTAGITAALGMLVAVGAWWIYFDFVSQRRPWPRRLSQGAWFLLHLPMTLGIAAAGAALLNVVEHAGDPLATGPRWLLMGSVALLLLTIASLMRVIRVPRAQSEVYRRGGRVTAGAGLAVLLLGTTPLQGIPLLSLVILIMLLPVFYGLKAWILMLDQAGSAEAVASASRIPSS